MNNELPTLNELDRILACINWADRQTWYETYIACGRAYRQDEQVFQLLQRHSSAWYTNKTQDEKQERTEYFKSSTTGSGLGIGTVIHFAKQGGYRPPEKEHSAACHKVSAVDTLKVDINSMFRRYQQPDAPETTETRLLTAAVDKARAVLNYWVFGFPGNSFGARLEFLAKYSSRLNVLPSMEREAFELLSLYCTTISTTEFAPDDFLRWASNASKSGLITPEAVRSACEQTSFNDVTNHVSADRYFTEALQQAWMWSMAMACNKAYESILNEGCGPDLTAAAEHARDILNRLGASAARMDDELEVLKDAQIIRAGAQSLVESICPNSENSRFIPTGYQEIDEHIKGYSRGEVSILAAHSGTGKTWFAIDVLRKMAEQGKRVVFFSTEMVPAALSERFLLNVSEHSLNELIKVNSGNLTGGQRMFYEVVEKGTDFVKQHGGLTIVGARSNGLSISQIASTLTNMALQKQVDIVVIDYLQDIQNDITRSGKVQNWEKVVDTMGQLRRIAMDFNIPILALAQLNNPNRNNNNGKSKVPGLYDIADASYVVRDAAAVLIMYNVASEESPGKGAGDNDQQPQAGSMWGAFTGNVGKAPPSPEHTGSRNGVTVSTRLYVAKSRHGESSSAAMLVKRTSGSRFHFVAQR